MIKVTFICDNCKETVKEQLLSAAELIERPLIRVSHQEWCPKCVYNKVPEILNFPDKSEFYGTKA